MDYWANPRCVLMDSGGIYIHTDWFSCLLRQRGTPGYMAPELFNAKHPPGLAVDVYSFGVVLHNIITGNEPDRQRGMRALGVPDECSALVSSLYQSCVSEDPGARPTASDIVSILEKDIHFSHTQSDLPPRIKKFVVNRGDVKLVEGTSDRPMVLQGANAYVVRGQWQAREVAVRFGSLNAHTYVTTYISDASHARAVMVRSEADILCGLRHPNIVSLMAVCLSPGDEMTILEYCSGGSLQEILEEASRRKPKSSLLPSYWGSSKQGCEDMKVALHIARGLAYLHDRQIIHYGIRPANILFDKDLSPKITNIGLTRPPQGCVVTMMEAADYMAPELKSSQHSPSFAVDVYSFGVVLHNIITVNERGWWTARRALRVPGDCSPVVASLYKSCVSVDPKDRPTASEIVSVLEKELKRCERDIEQGCEKVRMQAMRERSDKGE